MILDTSTKIFAASKSTSDDIHLHLDTRSSWRDINYLCIILSGNGIISFADETARQSFSYLVHAI